MNVLHVISTIDPRAGGTTAAMAGMAESQQRAGLNVTVVATHTSDFNRTVADDLEARGVTVHLIGPCHTPLNWHPKIRPVLRSLIGQSDIVHIHAVWEEIQHRAARLAHKLGVPYILSPHGMLDPWCLNQSKLKKQVYMALRLRRDLNNATAMSFTTKTEQELVKPLGLKPPGIVESLGIDLDEFEVLPEPGTFHKRFPQIADRPTLIFLSRIHYKKGLDLLIPALAAMKNSDAMLVVAGPDSEDNYRAKVEAMVQEHGVGDRVIFTGMLYGRERIEAMADAELFVLPSYQENFGVVVIEALACRTPVVISDQVNIHHEITAGEVGEVVQAQVEPLTAALDRWLGDDELRKQVAERARPFVWENYDWKQIGRRWVDHYSHLLGQAPSAST
jgi:glycosyltransferase involved in cell wall biosynthesis